MHKRLKVSLLAAVIAVVTGCAGTYQSASVDVRSDPRYGAPGGELRADYFYDALSPYGRWVQNDPFGWCWTPYDVTADWRPYAAGRWEYTDLGWTWDSDESWGWATDHYGRWLDSADYGWVWVPGTEWGPAWVAWREGEDWVGWAPLPPEAGWAPDGIRFAGASSIPAQSWCFVPRSDLVGNDVRQYVVTVARNVTLVDRTQDATRYEVRGGRPANVGVDVDTIERASGRSVPRLKLVDARAPRRGPAGSIGAGAVGFFRPIVRDAAPGAAPRPGARAAGVPAADPAAANRGWDAERRRLEASLAAQRAALERDHQRESRDPGVKVAPDELRRRQGAEQQAFEAHAAQMRKVFDSRRRNQVVRPGPRDGSRKPARGAMGSDTTSRVNGATGH